MLIKSEEFGAFWIEINSLATSSSEILIDDNRTASSVAGPFFTGTNNPLTIKLTDGGTSADDYTFNTTTSQIEIKVQNLSTQANTVALATRIAAALEGFGSTRTLSGIVLTKQGTFSSQGNYIKFTSVSKAAFTTVPFLTLTSWDTDPTSQIQDTHPWNRITSFTDNSQSIDVGYFLTTGSNGIAEFIEQEPWNGATYGSSSITQTGVRLTLGSTGVGFNQTRLQFTEDHWGSNTQKRVFFFADLGGTTSGWQATTQTQNFGMRGDDTTVTIADQVTATITAWNANQDDSGADMASSLGDPLWILLTVTGDTTSFDIYAIDGSNITLPTLVGDRNDLSITIASTSRSLTQPVLTARDANRNVSGTTCRFFSDNTIAAAGYSLLPVSVSASTTIDLEASQLVTIGEGVDVTFDNTDVDINLKDNSAIQLAGPVRDALFGGKNYNVTSSTLSSFPVIATNANPINVNMSNSASFGLANITQTNPRNIISRTFFGNNQAQSTTPFVLFNFIDCSTYDYGIAGNTFFYPMVGSYNNFTYTINRGATGTAFFEISQNVKLQDNFTLNHIGGTLQFNGGTSGVLANASTYSYASQCVMNNFEIKGAGTTAFGAFQPRDVHFVFANPILAGSPYFGSFIFDARGVNNVGIASLGIRYNPIFTFGGNALSNMRESYYYGTSTDTTLVECKELHETGAVGTPGTQNHPFVTLDGGSVVLNPISSSLGLEDCQLGTGNQYFAGSAVRTTLTNNNGICVAFVKGVVPTTPAAGTNLTFNTVSQAGTDGNFFIYRRRNGYRPSIIDKSFKTGVSGSPYAGITETIPFDAFVDGAWQGVAENEANSYVTVSYENSGSENLFTITPDATATNWNRIYRGIEQKFNTLAVIGNNIPAGTVNGSIRRLIDSSTPLTGNNEANCENFNLNIPLGSSISPGTGDGAVTGIFTPGIITFPNATDFNDSLITASGTINLDGTTTNGIFTANIVDSSGITLTTSTLNADTHTMAGTTVTGCTLGPENSGTYTVTHTGGFEGVTMASSGTLNTDDASLHGLTADSITINYTGTTADFSVDSPGAITNSTINLNSITEDITFNINEDLSTCDLVNTTTFTVTIVLGDSGVLPTASAGGSLTGNFSISRTINVGLSVGDQVRYIIRDASTDALIINTTFTATASIPNIPFSSTAAIDAFIIDIGADGYKRKEILILNNSEQDIVRSFETEINLNIAIQDSADNRQFVDDYTDDVTIVIDTSDSTMANFVCPPSFTSGGTTQTPSDNTFWDTKGSRGAGQYALKKIAEKSDYGIMALNNKAGLSEAQPQLFQITAADTVTFTTNNIQLHSQASVTVNSFFPAQFEVGPGVTNNIIGSPNGLVNIYQAANVVINTNDNLAFVKGEVGDELDERRVTRENMNNLGILAPINDSDPT